MPYLRKTETGSYVASTGACPVLEGEKWSMTKWIHASHYNMGGDKYDREYQEYTERMAAFKAGSSKTATEL